MSKISEPIDLMHSVTRHTPTVTGSGFGFGTAMNSAKETRSVDRDALKLLIQDLGDLYKSLDGESDAAIEEFLWPQIRVQYRL